METNAEQTAGTVLIVDDNMINRAVLENIFAPQYTVIEAENGKEALDMLMEHREEICAVILDVIMPVMDGIEALEKMNILGITEQIPVFPAAPRIPRTGSDKPPTPEPSCRVSFQSPPWHLYSLHPVSL